MATETHLSELAADLLKRAKKRGATEADVVVADGDTFDVQVRLSAVDRLTKAREKRLGLRVFIGKRSASASTSDFSRESLEQVVSDTCSLASAGLTQTMPQTQVRIFSFGIMKRTGSPCFFRLSKEEFQE